MLPISTNGKTWLFDLHKLITNYLNTDFPTIPQSAPTTEGLLTLETSATHQTPEAKNIPYQPLLVKPAFSLLANAEKTGIFSKLVFQCWSSTSWHEFNWSRDTDFVRKTVSNIRTKSWKFIHNFRPKYQNLYPFQTKSAQNRSFWRRPSNQSC